MGRAGMNEFFTACANVLKVLVVLYCFVSAWFEVSAWVNGKDKG